MYSKFKQFPLSLKAAIIFVITMLTAATVVMPYEMLIMTMIAVAIASVIRIMIYIVEGR